MNFYKWIAIGLVLGFGTAGCLVTDGDAEFGDGVYVTDYIEDCIGTSAYCQMSVMDEALSELTGSGTLGTGDTPTYEGDSTSSDDSSSGVSGSYYCEALVDCVCYDSSMSDGDIADCEDEILSLPESECEIIYGEYC